MGDWRLLALTSAISLVSSVIVAVVTAMLTSYFTHKNDAKKLIHEKRTELYYSFYGEVEKLINNRNRIFEKDYFLILINYEAKIRLIASQKVREETEKFYNFVREGFRQYRDFIEEHDPEIDPSKFQTICNDFGEEYEICTATEGDVLMFKDKLERYKMENIPSAEEFREIVIPLYNAMREDLGSNL